MWIGKSGMTKRVIQGFDQKIKKLAPDLKNEYQKELPDKKSAEMIFKNFNKKKETIVFLRSSGAKFLASHTLNVPGFIGGCKIRKYWELFRNWRPLLIKILTE